MNPQHEHYLFELDRHQLNKPTIPQHNLPELTRKQHTWRENVSSSLQTLGRLRKIRIQIIFELSEPRPDGC